MEKCVLFDTGFITRTAAATAAMFRSHITEHSLVERHQSGDYGNVTEARKTLNNDAAHHGGQVVSAYRLPFEAQVVQIVTDADRGATLVRLLSEA